MNAKGSAWVFTAAGLAGACSMALELSAVRLIAPWFGTSSVVWTHVIGVVLLALSSGYLIGARFSRGQHPERVLGTCLLGAGAATAWLPALAAPVTSWFRPPEIALDEAASLLMWGSLASALMLFLPPTLLLGCVTPLAAESVHRRTGGPAGDAGGRVLAASTVGSIAGTFATTYVVLPMLGLTRTYVGAGVILALIGVATLVRCGASLGSVRLAIAVGALAGAFGSRLRPPDVPLGWRLRDAAESAYQSIRVVETVLNRRPFRRLQVNEGFDSFQSVWQEQPGLLPDGYYYNLFVLPAWWSARVRDTADPWRVFVLGLGAGTTWRVLEGACPKNLTLDLTGAEIDASVVEMGFEWLDLPRVDRARRVLAGWDARAALRATGGSYDEIVLDVYANQMEIPAHLCSRELFVEVLQRLKPGGWLAVNIGGFGLQDPVVEAVSATAAHAFGRRVLALRVPFSRNCILLARRDADVPEPGRPEWWVGDAGIDVRLSALALAGASRWFEPSGSSILTDDRNPIEALQRESIRTGRAQWQSSP